MKNTLTGIILIAISASVVIAQTPTSRGFDVVSIKPSDPSARGMSIGLSPSGDFNAKGATVQALIQQAYDLRPFQVSGAPGWLDTERYDVITKSESGGPSEDALRKMTEDERNAYREKLMAELRLMLADRFQLKTHRETKELPVYALVIAKTGSKLQVAPDDGNPGGSLSMRRGDTGMSEMTGKKLPLASLVKVLSGQLGRTILDQTGLKGNYDFKMTWAPDLTQRPPDVGGSDPSSAGSDGPSVFTAVQEQLGLKLDSQKGPVEVLVIDSVQKPSEN